MQAPAPRPASLTDLFASFSMLALQGFGGVLAVVQRELVEKKKWLKLLSMLLTLTSIKLYLR